MAVNYSTITSTTAPSAEIAPYQQYGLSEAQRLYQAGGSPVAGQSDATQAGLQAMTNRATAGSPLMGAAQTQQMGTIAGDYLSGNPFFQGAFQPAAQAATSTFNNAISNIGSQASRAGRYGSGAFGDLQNQASGQLAQGLTNTAGQLAYQNYANERGRQEQASSNAPSMAQSDYFDIQKLLGAGNVQDQYSQMQNNQPQIALQNYLSSLGMNMGQSSTQSTPFYTNDTANTLGDVSSVANIIGKLTNQSNGPSAMQLGYDWFKNILD